MEVVLSEAAEISELSSELLLPARLPGLWQADRIKLADLRILRRWKSGENT